MSKRVACFIGYLLYVIYSSGAYANGSLSLSVEAEKALRTEIVKEALSNVGVKETSENCSPEIRAWCTMHGLPCGIYWCAIFFGAMYKICGVHAQLNAWSPAWFPPERRISFEMVQPADPAGIHSPLQNRVVHMFMI